MRREWLQMGLVLVMSASLIGCRGFGRGRHASCESCEMGDGIVMDGEYVDGGDCTICGKPPLIGGGTIIEGAPILESSPGALIVPGQMPGEVLESVPPEAPMPPVAPQEPKKSVKVEKPESLPMPMPMPMPEAPPVPEIAPAKPAAINVQLKSSVGVATAGQEITFDVTIENTGSKPIESADIVATLSAGLKPISVSPEGVARIEGQKIVFEPLRSFQPMSVTYKIVAEAVPSNTEGKLGIRITSPILTAGPLEQETVVRITP